MAVVPNESQVIKESPEKDNRLLSCVKQAAVLPAVLLAGDVLMPTLTHGPAYITIPLATAGILSAGWSAINWLYAESRRTEFEVKAAAGVLIGWDRDETRCSRPALNQAKLITAGTVVASLLQSIL